MNKIGIYKIENKITKKVYIGQSTNILSRWRAHKSSAYNLSDCGYKYPLYRAIRKYGLKNFSFQILEECLVSDLNNREKYYIEKYSSLVPAGYNQVLPKQGGTTVSHPHILAIIELLKTTDLSDEEIGERYGISGRTVRSINYGESWYDEKYQYPIKNRQPQIQNKECPKCKGPKSKGAKLCMMCYRYAIKSNTKYRKTKLYKAKETDRKILKKKKEIDIDWDLIDQILTTSFEEVGRVYGYTSGNAIKAILKRQGLPYLKSELYRFYEKHKGHLHPIEEKRINAQRRRNQEIVQNKLKTRPIVVEQYSLNGEYIATYNSITEAGQAVGCQSGNISEQIRGKRKTAGGFIWKKKED